ncbi:lipocalin family protein [uncultured Aquimarina sp.]|uniref:lipocalin family protein n=1 Tax=uncultured Aquimarina sp. TaxID=575652 RepID=UPI002605D701|nr:lipocalin family protein [uncultured Aquimarina sp.]
MNLLYRLVLVVLISGVSFSCSDDDSDSSDTAQSITGKWQLEEYFTNDGFEDLPIEEANLSDCEKLSIIEVLDTEIFVDTGYFTSSADNQCVLESTREGTWKFISSGVFSFSYKPEDVINEEGATEGVVLLLENNKLSLSFSYGSGPTLDKLIYTRID